jgi:hypothetical protein
MASPDTPVHKYHPNKLAIREKVHVRGRPPSKTTTAAAAAIITNKTSTHIEWYEIRLFVVKPPKNRSFLHSLSILISSRGHCGGDGGRCCCCSPAAGQPTVVVVG